MLVDLDHTESLIIVLVDDCLNARRFTCSTITEQQYIIGFSALYKRFCIINQLLFLDLIADKIIKHDLIQIIDRVKVRIALPLIDQTEGFVQTEHTDTVSLVKIGDRFKEFILILCLLQLFTECLYLFTDIFIVHQLFFADCLVIGQNTEALDAECFLDRFKIKEKQVAEHSEIILCENIDAAIICTDLFTGQTERIFVCDEQICQIVVPQIMVKAVIRCHLQTALELRINIPDKLCIVLCLFIKCAEDLSQLYQDRILLHITVHDQFCDFFIHILPP